MPSLTITASRVGIVNSDQPTTNFNSLSSYLIIGGVSSPDGTTISSGENRQWLNFNLGTNISGSTVNSATLTLTSNLWNNSPNYFGHVFIIDRTTPTGTNWTASTITWNNAPAANLVGDAITYNPESIGAYADLIIDVTSHVAHYTTGSAQITWQLSEDNALTYGEVYYAPAHLTVNYTLPVMRTNNALFFGSD